MSYIQDKCRQPLPESLSLGDLKLIALNADAGERLIKAGLERGGYFMSDTDYTVQLIKLLLIAAINSPKAPDYIGKMLTLSTSTQALLKESIEEVLDPRQATQKPPVGTDIRQLQDTTHAASDSDVPSTSARSSPPPPPAVDAELLFEERFGKVMADNERLARENHDVQKNVRDLQNRLGRLQQNNVGQAYIPIYHLADLY